MSDLISDEYRDQLQKMRSEAHRPRWGNGGQRHVDRVLGLINQFHVKSVLDYGCGHGVILASLAERLGAKAPALAGYDPGIPERAALPAPAELVISTDVLEHIEPDKLDGVLAHIRSLAQHRAYLNIHTGPANAKLPDGRNAHLIQQPAQWWHRKLYTVFPVVNLLEGGLRPTFLCE
jgi:hypothetical protein